MDADISLVSHFSIHTIHTTHYTIALVKDKQILVSN